MRSSAAERASSSGAVSLIDAASAFAPSSRPPTVGRMRPGQRPPPRQRSCQSVDEIEFVLAVCLRRPALSSSSLMSSHADARCRYRGFDGDKQTVHRSSTMSNYPVAKPIICNI